MCLEISNLTNACLHKWHVALCPVVLKRRHICKLKNALSRTISSLQILESNESFHNFTLHRVAFTILLFSIKETDGNYGNMNVWKLTSLKVDTWLIRGTWVLWYTQIYICMAYYCRGSLLICYSSLYCKFMVEILVSICCIIIVRTN